MYQKLFYLLHLLVAAALIGGGYTYLSIYLSIYLYIYLSIYLEKTLNMEKSLENVEVPHSTVMLKVNYFSGTPREEWSGKPRPPPPQKKMV